MVKWSSPARADLKLIYDYISKESKFYAQNVVQNMVSKTNLLDDFPKMGRVVPEIGEPNIRELFIYSYRLIYEIVPDGIWILSIVHGKRDFHPDDVNR